MDRELSDNKLRYSKQEVLKGVMLVIPLRRFQLHAFEQCLDKQDLPDATGNALLDCKHQFDQVETGDLNVLHIGQLLVNLNRKAG